MIFEWDNDKNNLLKQERDVCFEDVITAINEDKILDIINHPNQDKYPNQKLYIIELKGYTHMVPFVRDGDKIFLKTIVPSRKLHKIYKGGSNGNR